MGFFDEFVDSSWPGNRGDPNEGQGGGNQVVYYGSPGKTGATGATGAAGKDANPLLSILLAALQMTQAKKLANKQQPIDPMQLYQMLMQTGRGNKPQGVL